MFTPYVEISLYAKKISCFRLLFLQRSLDEEKAAVAGSTSFTNEVGDLRQKAAYYGARHLGTHISRDHLGQLVARNADRWDDPGSPNSDLRAEDGRGLASALDLAKARGGKRVGVAPKNKTYAFCFSMFLQFSYSKMKNCGRLVVTKNN